MRQQVENFNQINMLRAGLILARTVKLILAGALIHQGELMNSRFQNSYRATGSATRIAASSKSLRRGLSVMAVAVAMVIPAGAGAAPFVMSLVEPYIGNSAGYTANGQEQVSYTGAHLIGSGNYHFNGIDQTGSNAAMDFYYVGQAQASAAGLKAGVSAMLSNAFYNSSNTPYTVSDGAGGVVVNPNGVPTTLIANAMAQFYDTFTVIGGAGLSYVTFSVAIDGSTGSNFPAPGSAYAALYQTGSNFNTLWTSGSAITNSGDHDAILNSSQVLVSSGKVSFGLSLLSQVMFSLDGGWTGNNFDDLYEASADFFNTVTIGSVSGFNANGMPVDLQSAAGSDGRSYATVRVNGEPDPGNQIPEPASLALMGIGALAMVAMRRKHQQTWMQRGTGDKRLEALSLPAIVTRWVI